MAAGGGTWPTETKGGWPDELLPRPAYSHEAVHDDAKRLYKAVWSSTDVERTAAEVLGPRSNAELQQLQQVYRETTQRDLRQDLKSGTGGKLGKLVRRSLLTPVELDAKLVKDAIAGVGTDERALAEVCTYPEPASDPQPDPQP